MRILDVDPVALSEASGLSDRLVPGEQVEVAFRSPTAALLFTDRRIVLVSREALLSERVETSSYSYRAIQHFSVVESSPETRGALKVWLGSDPQPLHLRANDGTDFGPLHIFLAGKLV
jgi:hypothetical protein